MKKTLTITTARTQNYGAVLQAYALHKKIFQLGGQNEIIYLESERPRFFEKMKGYGFKIKLIKLLENIFKLIRYPQSKRNFNRFIEFSENNFKHTKEILELDEIELKKYDAIITGSDQMFGFGPNSQINKARFLFFRYSGKIKRYSFAASFGEYDFTEVQLEFLKQQLNQYEIISVRETQGKKYLKEKLNIEAQVNIDPVFLLKKEDWEKIIEDEKIIKNKYILCYFLVSSPILESMIKNLKKKYGYPVVCVQTTAIKRIKADKYIFDAGPKEFLNLIKNAEFVITTSFHGTAFSIIFEKDFYSILKKGYRTERFESLLEKLNLKDRMLSSVCEEITSINYQGVSKIITKNREKNIQYLEKILEK